MTTFRVPAASRSVFFAPIVGLVVLASVAVSDPPESGQGPAVPAAQGEFRTAPPLNPLPQELLELVRPGTALNPENTVLLDLKNRRLLLHTQVSCRNCLLEMLCCPEGQREHETILAIRTKAFVVHSGLLALDLEPGTPVEFSPEFKPPDGPQLSIVLHWVSEDGKLQKCDAREWIRKSIHRYFAFPLKSAPPGVELPHDELRYDTFNSELIWFGPMTDKQREHLLTLWDDQEYGKAIEKFYEQSQSRPMEATFVFTGSRWDVFEQGGRRRYAAEDGHLITVANFSSATVDIAEASSADEGGLAYEGWTERIPPVGTPVIIEITAAEDADREKTANKAERGTKPDQEGEKTGADRAAN